MNNILIVEKARLKYCPKYPQHMADIHIDASLAALLDVIIITEEEHNTFRIVKNRYYDGQRWPIGLYRLEVLDDCIEVLGNEKGR